MKLKNVLKTLGAAAALASVIPYRVKKDEETDETTVQALLWKVTTRPHPDLEDKRSVSVGLGFYSPLAQDECCCDLPEDGLFDELADCGCCEAPVQEVQCPCCDPETPADLAE